MKMVCAVLSCVVAMFAVVASQAALAREATLMPADKAAQIVSLQGVTVKNGAVSGEIVNHSKNTVRDVQLQILYSWRWQDEFRPGKDDPGRAEYHSVKADIPPGETVKFTYSPSPPLPTRADGDFAVAVSVVGFAQVIRQDK